MEFEINEEVKIVQFIELFKFMKNVSQYVSMICTDELINIQLLDDSHVSLLDIKFKCSWFSKYNCEKHITFSINNLIFNKILNIYTLGSFLHCSLNDDTFDISFLNKEENKYFTIHLLDIDKDILSPQSIETSLDFSIKTKLFDKYINDISIFGDDIEISCKDDKISLSSNSEEGKILIVIDNENLVNFNVVDDYDVSFKYSIKYIQYITKLKIVFHTTHIFIDENSPLIVKFDNIDIDITYYIAPKTEDEN